MPRTRSTLVRDVAVATVETVGPAATLARCAQLMREHHVGSLVVVNQTGALRRPIGIITDRDIVLEAVAPMLDPRTLTVAEVMGASVATVRDDDDVIDALARMREQGVRRIPVTDAAGELAGIVAMDDLLVTLAEQLKGIAAVCAAERTREMATRATR